MHQKPIQYEVTIKFKLPENYNQTVPYLLVMKWVKLRTTDQNEVYSLVKADKNLLILDFNYRTNSARIEYAGTKRIFKIRREGFLKNKTVLCNEYGVKLAQHENDEPVSFLQSALKLALTWYLTLPANAPKPLSQTAQEMGHVHP